MDDYILEIPNFVSKELCNDLVKRFESDTRKKHVPIFYNVCGKKHEAGKFSKEIVMVSHKEYEDLLEPVHELFYRVYEKYLEHLDTKFDHLNKGEYPHPYIREIKSKRQIGIKSGLVLHKIDKGQFYSWHHDHLWNSCDGFLQVLIYLNTLEEHEGGQTEFTNGRKVTPEIGKVLVHPRSWTFLHKGNEILENKPKYICTADILIRFEE